MTCLPVGSIVAAAFVAGSGDVLGAREQGTQTRVDGLLRHGIDTNDHLLSHACHQSSDFISIARCENTLTNIVVTTNIQVL